MDKPLSITLKKIQFFLIIASTLIQDIILLESTLYIYKEVQLKFVKSQNRIVDICTTILSFQQLVSELKLYLFLPQSYYSNKLVSNILHSQELIQKNFVSQN